MARSQPPPPPDPYEHGFEVVQRQRMPLPDLTPEGMPLSRPPRVSWKWVLAGLAVVVAIGVGRGVTATSGSALKANCHRAQIALSERSVTSKGSGLLHWSVTAAAGTRFVVAVNASSLAVTGAGDVHATPAKPAASQVSPTQTMSGGCLAHGFFGVLVPPGTYPVTLFRVDPAGSAQLATARIRVTAS